MASHAKKHGSHYVHEHMHHKEDDDIGQTHRPAKSPQAALKRLSSTGQKSGSAGAGSRR